ncbi:hypothetical protein F4780DRAFT_690015 [Xylariomycetidae sp. FL0641]|nr:hypothetical protein F4780DRAFT_690015 [Xylariomycetidae sp. FL0641]
MNRRPQPPKYAGKLAYTISPIKPSQSQPDMATPEKPHFLTLPGEIREQIYSILFHPNNNRLHREDEYTSYDYRAALALFHVNHQIYYEARKVFRHLNVFVLIETPWSEAEEHVKILGHVPIVMKSKRAARFESWSLRAQVEAPAVGILGDGTPEQFVILADDLPTFTRTWFYSNLTNPGLNSFLRVTLHLKDPFSPEWEEKRIPRQVQQRLLRPWGEVKDLRHFDVVGDVKPQPSILAEVEAEQKVPSASPEKCLSEATRLKNEGNAALSEGRYKDALMRYNEAWEAMHIVIKGHQRHVHAEAFFAKDLTEAPYAGQNGQVERLKLRVALVANTCLVYLKLGEWEEAQHWGLRSITLMRQASDANDRDDVPPEEEAMLRFPAAAQVGKIYYRTALACKELDDKSQARRLLRVAAVYLPHDETIRKEIAACALRLG